MLVLPRSTSMQNLGCLALKLNELWSFEIFGICYGLVFCGMVWHGIVWCGVLVFPRTTTMQNFGLVALK